MIPRKLHSIWLNGKLPKFEKTILKKSLKINDDYDHFDWSLENVESCKFLEIAMNEKLYAFASDYIRFYILYNYGGFYLDSDMELKNKIPKEWLTYSLVLPKETEYEVGGHFIGCVPKNRFIRNILNEYITFNGDEIDKSYWVITSIIKRNLFKVYGKYSITNTFDGSFKSSKDVYLANVKQLSPYYPWDIERIRNVVDIDNCIGIHYWNHYKKKNKLKLKSFDSKEF